jgi:hypothetical protein
MLKTNLSSDPPEEYLWEGFPIYHDLRFSEEEDSDQYPSSQQPIPELEEDSLPLPSPGGLLALDPLPSLTHFDTFFEEVIDDEESKKDEETCEDLVKQGGSGLVDHLKPEEHTGKFIQEELHDCGLTEEEALSNSHNWT